MVKRSTLWEHQFLKRPAADPIWQRLPCPQLDLLNAYTVIAARNLIVERSAAKETNVGEVATRLAAIAPVGIVTARLTACA
jgi:hypothetical protein